MSRLPGPLAVPPTVSAQRGRQIRSVPHLMFFFLSILTHFELVASTSSFSTTPTQLLSQILFPSGTFISTTLLYQHKPTLSLSPWSSWAWRWAAGCGRGPGWPKDHEKEAPPGRRGSKDPPHPCDSYSWKNAWKRLNIKRLQV